MHEVHVVLPEQGNILRQSVPEQGKALTVPGQGKYVAVPEQRNTKANTASPSYGRGGAGGVSLGVALFRQPCKFKLAFATLSG